MILLYKFAESGIIISRLRSIDRGGHGEPAGKSNGEALRLARPELTAALAVDRAKLAHPVQISAIWDPDCGMLIAERGGAPIQRTNCDPGADDRIQHVFIGFKINTAGVGRQ